MAGDFGCTPDQEAAVLALVGDEVTALTVCSSYNCTVAVNCVTQYTLNALEALREANDDINSATSTAGVALGTNVAFVLFSAYLVFMMQLGFAMLCAGCVRSKNCMNILLKNVLDACVGSIGWYLLGYAFANGSKDPINVGSNEFIGNWNFALSYTSRVSWPDGEDPSGAGFELQGWHMYFFQWTFCAASATIVSGAVAERCTFVAYISYSFFISAFVFPVVLHWVWSPDGWLSPFNTRYGEDPGHALILKTGAIDFSGSGVVHMTGGTAAIIGAWVLGPRIGRFSACGRVNEMRGHSATLVVLGSCLLWFGWYGFNPGSNLAITGLSNAVVVSRVAVTTTLAGGTGGVANLLFKFAVTRNWDAQAVCMGVLSGLVSVTASCAVIEPWAAIIVGAFAPMVFYGMERLLLQLRIDDPVAAFPLHYGCGLLGVLYPGLLAKPDYVFQVYGSPKHGIAEGGHRYGWFYGGHGQVMLLQVLEALSITAWVALMMLPFFLTLRALNLLRVPVEAELAGLDVSKHGGSNGPYGGGGVVSSSVRGAAEAAAEDCPY